MTPEERKELISDIIIALESTTIAPPILSDEEHRWVKMAIQKEAQSIELRKAIIEKTLAGLVWMIIVGFGYVFLDFAKSHILK